MNARVEAFSLTAYFDGSGPAPRLWVWGGRFAAVRRTVSAPIPVPTVRPFPVPMTARPRRNC